MKSVRLIVLASLLLVFGAMGCDGEDHDLPAPATNTPQPAAASYPAPIEPLAEPIGEAVAEQGVESSVNNLAAIDAEQPPAASAYIVIQNASPTDPALLVRQLQQVLPKTQVVKQMQSPDTREIKLEVTNINDVRALANKIPFASVEKIDAQTRTITVDFDL